ncbi:MAG TPA: hypothetical protein VIU61_22625 [Kofleriaceae bacterium]
MARNARAEYLVTRFGEYEGPDDWETASAKLVKMGARAVPSLIRALADDEYGWCAASVLHDIGLPAARPATRALIKYASDPKANAQLWSARALGVLGKLDVLVELANQKRTRDAGIAGLVAARPESYPHLGRLLDRARARKDRAFLRHVGKELDPGSASYALAAAQFELVVEATRSPHVALRKDAVCALGDLGSKRARAALEQLLVDRSAEVRRLARVLLD